MSNSKPSAFKLSFAGAKNKNALKPASAPPAKKPRLALGDDEPEDSTKSVEISGWDTTTGGAIDLNEKKKEDEGPRVIPALPNRNWRQEAARKNQKESSTKAEDNTEQYQESNIQYGLTIVKKAPEEGSENAENGDVEMKDAGPVDDGLTEEQRLEKRALDALLSGKPTDPGAIIPAQTEEEAFDEDYANAPEEPTLDTYEATPIDGFGAALLRGMGWKDGEEIGRNKGNPSTKPREIKRRPALLGIGAKEEAAVGIEFGEWGGGKGKKKSEQAYNPVMLKNKVTGELVTEEELKKKLEAQEMVKEDKKERRDRHEEDEDKEYERRRERKHKEKKERDRRRGDDYYDSDRKKDRRRDDAYYDSDRRREKRRERERRDRDRSRSPDSDDKVRRKDRRRDDDYSDDDRRREKRRDRERRDRSRSPDSEDRRKRRRDRDYDNERDDRKRRNKDDRYRDSDREDRKKRYKDDEYYRR